MGNVGGWESGLENVEDLVWMEGDAEALSLEDNSMDGYTIAFGIRNVTHIDRALKEAHRQVSTPCRYFVFSLCGLFDVWIARKIIDTTPNSFTKFSVVISQRLSGRRLFSVCSLKQSERVSEQWHTF
jgi:ubiquinone/menaquinone biosynthesis C-methylase UbiE